MINIYFILKEKPISHTAFDMEYTSDNIKLVDSMLNHGLINKPESYDRIIRQEHMLDGIFAG